MTVKRVKKLKLFASFDDQVKKDLAWGQQAPLLQRIAKKKDRGFKDTSISGDWSAETD